MSAPAETSVTVYRREPHVSGVTLDGQDYTYPGQPLSYDPQGAPDPIRQSEYWNVGKPAELAWSSMPVSLHMNVRGILGVMKDNFMSGKVRAQYLTFMGNALGGQQAFMPGTNIDRGDSAPYGNQQALAGQPVAYYPPGSRVVSANGMTYSL